MVSFKVLVSNARSRSRSCVRRTIGTVVQHRSNRDIVQSGWTHQMCEPLVAFGQAWRRQCKLLVWSVVRSFGHQCFDCLQLPHKPPELGPRGWVGAQANEASGDNQHWQAATRRHTEEPRHTELPKCSSLGMTS